MSENFPAEVSFSEQSNVMYIKLQGEFRFRDSGLLQKCLSKIQENLELQGLIVDLMEAHSVDSTILGVLAEMGVLAGRVLTERPVILAHADDISRVLNAMGFDKIFNLVTDLPAKQIILEKIEKQEETDHELILRVLAAHKTLSSLSEENARQFREVIDLFEENLKKIS